MTVRIDGTNSTANPAITGADTDTGLQFGTDEVSIVTDGTARATVDSSGRLLVGTSSSSANVSAVFRDNSAQNGPAEILLATSSATPAITEVLARIHFSANNQSFAANIEGSRDGGTWTAGSSQPSKLTFSTTADGSSTPTERMRIQSDGKISIANPPVVSEHLTISATGSVVNGICVRATDASTTTAFVCRNNSAVPVGNISYTTTTTTYSTSSDYRLKENVVPLTGAADRLNQLQVHRFNFIADPDKTVDGFLAHEVQTIVPEAITGEKDAVDDEGNPEYQGIDQSKLVPLLTAALQEAIAKIEVLEAKVTALEVK